MTKEKARQIKISLTPDKSIYEKLGKGQHKLWDSIAELIDNAVDARTEGQLAGKEKLHISIKMPLHVHSKYADFIEIEDDGKGMSEEEAKNCLVLAKSKHERKFSKYGLGLKQSCLSIGKKFTIVTKQKDIDFRYEIIFDNDNFKATEGWNSIISKIPDRGDFHGTKIRIEKFWNEKLIYKEKLTRLIKRLSFIVGPFISQKLLEVKINTKQLEPQELPDIIGKEDLKLKLDSGHKVTGWVGFRKAGGSTVGLTGFSLYRNSRLIKAHQHIGYTFHAELRNLIGELHLDNFQVTIDKKDFLRTSTEWQQLVGTEVEGRLGQERFQEGALHRKLKSVIREHRKAVAKEREARRIQRARMAAEKRLEMLEKRDFTKMTEIKEEISATIAEIAKKVSSRENAKKPTESELHQQEKRLLKELIGKTFLDGKSIIIDDQEYYFEHKHENAGWNQQWYRVKLLPKKLVIISNMDHPFVNQVADLGFYFKLHTLMGLGDAISEIKHKSDEKGKYYFQNLLDRYANELQEQKEKRRLELEIGELKKQLKEKPKTKVKF